LADRGIVPRELIESYDLLCDVLVAGRLLANDAQVPPPAAAQALAQACGRDHYDALQRDLEAARNVVGKCWMRIFEQKLETEL